MLPLVSALGAALLGLALVSITPAQTSAAATVTVAVGDVWFCSSEFQGEVCTTTIDAGDTVVWDFSSGFVSHTTTECGASCDSPTASPLWTSGTMSAGTFSYTFAEPGTYLYYCQIHPSIQRGQIVVREAAEPTAPGASPTPGAGGAPAPTVPGQSLPKTGQGPNETSSTSWVLIAVAGSLAVAGASALLLGTKRPSS